MNKTVIISISAALLIIAVAGLYIYFMRIAPPYTASAGNNAPTE